MGSLLLLGAGGGGVGGGGGGPTDPLYSSVVLLWEAEGTDGQNSGITDIKNGRTINASGTGHIEQDQAHFGSTSYFLGTGGCNLADHADWDISGANGTPFCFEFSIYHTDLQTVDIGHFGSSPNWSWLVRCGSEITLFWSSDGSSLQSLSTSGAGITTNSWFDICAEKNTGGKLRIYVNGVMKASSTPANSAFWPNADILNFGSHPTSQGYIDHVRLTTAARYDSDSGYTPSTEAFPTS